MFQTPIGREPHTWTYVARLPIVTNKSVNINHEVGSRHSVARDHRLPFQMEARRVTFCQTTPRRVLRTTSSLSGSQDRHQSILGAHHHRLPRLRLLPHRIGGSGCCSAGRLGKGRGKLLYHVIGYMALFDSDDGIPWQEIKSTEAKTYSSQMVQVLCMRAPGARCSCPARRVHQCAHGQV